MYKCDEWVCGSEHFCSALSDRPCTAIPYRSTLLAHKVGANLCVLVA